MRSRIASAPGPPVRPGPPPGPTISSFLFVGCGASGQTTAMQPRSGHSGLRRGGRAGPPGRSRRAPRPVAQLQAEPPAWAGAPGRAAPARSSRARPTARRAPRRGPGRWRRSGCSSLNDGRPSSCVGQAIPWGAARTGSAPRRTGPSARARSATRGRRVDQVAPEQVARHLVVEADAVCSPRRSCPAAPARPRPRRRRACSASPRSRQVCGRMPVSRHDAGSGR